MLLVPMRADAQGDGPRAYFPTPVDMNVLTGYGLFLDGNRSLDPGVIFAEGDVDVHIGLLQYTRSLAVAGNAAGLFAIVPAGEVTGTLKGPAASVSSSSSGFGDILLGGAFTLYGMPAMPQEEYRAFNPDFAAGMLLKIGVPTGEYTSTQPINLGSNRWSLQAGLPLFYYFGESLLDEKLTTIEVLPSVTFFTNNNDPFGGDKLKQDPLVQIEAHITQNINRALWLSIDGIWTYGGETSMDGQKAGNTQQSIALGGSIGVNLNPAVSLKASYGKIVYRNDDGADGEMVRIAATLLF